MIYVIVLYFVFFWWEVIVNPYSIASAETIDADFGSFRLSGECWRKGKLPQDPYYYRYIRGVRPGTYYPINIFLSWLGSYMKLDNAWKVYVFNILVHNLATCLLAYYLFGQGFVGLLGALMWGFTSFHIKTTLWYSQLFTWITATLVGLKTQWAGLSLAMLILTGHPPFVVYFFYLMGWFIPISQIAIGLLLALPQIWDYYKYSKISIKKEETLEDKLKVGHIPWWIYFFMFIPIRYRDFIAQIGYEEWCFYSTPCALFFIFSTNLYLWVGFFLSFFLSLGIGWRYFHKLLHRWTYRWGYFVGLFVIYMAVTEVGKMQLGVKEMVVLNILTALLLTFNKDMIYCYPFKEKGRRPSDIFETPVLKWLEKNAKGYRVNNLPYQITGQINHILTVGYTGGNMIASLNKFLNSPKEGYAPYNWFDFLPDGADLDAYRIKYHFMERPQDKKWVKTPFKDLWENTNVGK